MIFIIALFMYIIVSLAWAIIGLLFWIAILGRLVATATIKTMLIMLSTSSDNATSENAFHIPSKALTFYFDGFSAIFNSILKKNNENNSNINMAKIIWYDVFLEIFWAFVFWFLILAVTGYV